ncbi:MAG TPA: 23S rRNA (pseudouridine(1915)-N(3))-methyltransferase RlmH [Thermodesulfobacteriota bacterium]|nr:23S rRNA (pseudouridine(1915)-N(3))-methyltransferase RlmH [Thermodesulfobacteriota bacterium]
MNFEIVTVGKIKKNFIKNGVAEFKSRIERYSSLTFFPIQEEPLLKGASEEVILHKEGERILSKVPRDGLWVALDRQGREMDSLEHFAFLNAQVQKGMKKIYYLIGGPLGLSPAVLNQAHHRLSLSRMTLTHEMSALFLIEQIYRYLNNRAGEKYHK